LFEQVVGRTSANKLKGGNEMKNSKPVYSLSKQQVAQNSMRFNRFMFFRYITALFFFVNLYWTILSIAHWTVAGMIPILLMVMDGCILVEQTQKYWQQSNRLKVTKCGLWIQVVINLIGVIFALIGQTQYIVPFMNQTGHWLLLGLFTLGLLICLYAQRKIWLIEHDQDKYLAYLKAFEGTGGK